jgi:AcrR family transcriptional regulator
MRADAQQNHDRLLDAAARAFATHGTEASLKDIAKDAGVGIGTLYRRFPNREVLVEAIYRNETARLGSAANELLEKKPPLEALRVWMDRFVDYIATKHGLGDALPVVLSSSGDLRMESRQLLADALAVLLEAGAADGSIRADAAPADVLMALGGITLIAAKEPPGLADRLLDLLVDGLRFSA